MAPSMAINTRTLAVLSTSVLPVPTTRCLELQVQIAKPAARGNTARPLEPQATLRAKTAARGNTAPLLEPLCAKVSMDGKRMHSTTKMIPHTSQAVLPLRNSDL